MEDLNEALTSHIEAFAKAAGVPWDTYHADFLMGVIMNWLAANDCALIGSGVRRRK